MLLQYLSVLQTTTPVLFCITSTTTLYYKVLLQYFSVLQSTTPVLLWYYSVLQSTTPVLLCTTKYYSTTTPVLLQYYSPYYKVLLQYTEYYSCITLYCKYYSCTNLYCKYYSRYYKVVLMIDSWHIWNVRGARKGSLQLHQILHLPRKINLVIDAREIWNAIYNAWSNKSHPPTSPNTAPATQKFMLWVTGRGTSFPMRGASKVTLQTHQVLRLPRKMNLMIDPCHIWNVIYNARNNRRHPPTSPNTAPATQNESHQWSASHMKRHFQ